MGTVAKNLWIYLKTSPQVVARSMGAGTGKVRV